MRTKGEAREFLRCALAARQQKGYFDCSTCPERQIFDHLWLDDSEYVAESTLPSNPFAGQWSYADSTEGEKWRWLIHVDIWTFAQEIQRKGVMSELSYLEMAKRDSGRRVWPVSLVRHPVHNEASSNAVKKVLDQYPWVDSGLQWKGTMVFKESPGEDRSTLFEDTKKPGVKPPSGPSTSSPDASSSSAPPAEAMPSALTKAETPAGKATSSGRPASEPDIKDKGDGTMESKPSTPLRATSESGITDPTKREDTSAGLKTSSTTVSMPTSSPRPSSSVASMPTASSALPKEKTSSEATPMSAPPAKPKAGPESGDPLTSRAPSGAASQSSVTAGSGYPTIAESLGQRKGPPLKAAPSSKTTTAPSTKSEDTGHAAAKGSTLVPPKEKAEQANPPSSTASTSQVQETAQPARAPRAPAIQAPVEKDAAMSYTEQVMKQAASAVPTGKLTDEDYERMAQERWQRILAESTTCVSGKAASVAQLPAGASRRDTTTSTIVLTDPRMDRWSDTPSPQGRSNN